MRNKQGADEEVPVEPGTRGRQACARERLPREGDRGAEAGAEGGPRMQGAAQTHQESLPRCDRRQEPTELGSQNAELFPSPAQGPA